MVAIAALLPTNTPAPMMPPMEIITRWRARRDLERREDAGRSASEAFNGDLALVVPDAANHTPEFFRRRCRTPGTAFDQSLNGTETQGEPNELFQSGDQGRGLRSPGA